MSNTTDKPLPPLTMLTSTGPVESGPVSPTTFEWADLPDNIDQPTPASTPAPITTLIKGLPADVATQVVAQIAKDLIRYRNLLETEFNEMGFAETISGIATGTAATLQGPTLPAKHVVTSAVATPVAAPQGAVGGGGTGARGRKVKHPALVGLHGREYMREYMRLRREGEIKLNPAARLREMKEEYAVLGVRIAELEKEIEDVGV